VGPLEDPAKRGAKQGPKRRLAYRPRARVCLLKGCESWFEPECAQQRYCPGACVEAAGAWSAWKARCRYRGSPKGRRARQKGSREYRTRRGESRGGISPARSAAGFFGAETASTPAETLPRVRLGASIDPGIAAPEVAFPGFIAPPGISPSGCAVPEVPHGQRPVVVFDGGSRGSSLSRAGEISCDRPGCYELFMRTPRSPAQRFCARPCRRALERVWQRETRWHARRGLG
jgi:hypothetical protein